MLFYLCKRNNSYYRIRVPSDLADLFPDDLIRISLKTKTLLLPPRYLRLMVQNSFAQRLSWAAR